MTLETLQQDWQDTPEHHIHTNDLFKSLMEQDPELNEHRTWVRERVFGMGEDSFHWFWKLMVDEMPADFSFLECGVHKAQVVSLIRLLASRLRKPANIYGITPMNGAGTGWTEDDYEGDIKKIHQQFELPMPKLLKGYSQEKLAVQWAAVISPFDVVYLDGDHTFDGVTADLTNYAPMVKSGGYLVMDDCACDTHQPWGFFQGIQEVQDAFDEYMKVHGDNWGFMFNVVHLRVMRRK